MPHEDVFFERLLDEAVGPVMVRGVAFEASAVAKLEPDAYRALKIDLLNEVWTRIEVSLDSESLDRLKRLPNLLPKGKVIPFIGAGLSAGMGLPAWSRFLENLAGGRVPGDSVRACLDKGELEMLANLIVESAGIELFDERLSIYDAFEDVSAAYRLLPRLFRQSVYTTNFDRVLETVYDQAGMAFSIIVRGSQTWHGLAAADSQGETALVKLHGDCRLPGTRVLSSSEYDAAYTSGSPLRRDIKHLFTAFKIVFIGCSLMADRTMEIARSVAQELGREGPTHYALLPYPQTSEARADRERYLNARHIFPIWFPAEDGDYSLLGEMLWAISNSLPEEWSS